MSRSRPVGTPMDPAIVLRSGSSGLVRGVSESAWFGPLSPIAPAVPAENAESWGVLGRRFDYPAGYNLRITPRQGESTSFAQLRTLSDALDILRLVIETRKDQLAKLEWQIVAKTGRSVSERKLEELTDWWQSPDKENEWDEWLRALLEDRFVIDAATLYPRRNRGGGVYGFELIDGATVLPVIDETGRRPKPPGTAYQQVIKGMPVVNYTADELVYRPRNVRTWKVYGLSEVEQILMTVNIALRRQIHLLQFYTEGNIPEALATVPGSWNVDQIAQYQEYWDSVLEGNTAERRKLKFIPDGTKYYPTKEGVLQDSFDEWLARIVCFNFSIPPTAFVKMVNRASGQQMQETALQEGLLPLMRWVKNLVNHGLWKYQKESDCMFQWSSEKDIDPFVQAQIDKLYVDSKVQTGKQIAEARGLEYDEEAEVDPQLTSTSGNPVEGLQGKKATPEIADDPGKVSVELGKIEAAANEAATSPRNTTPVPSDRQKSSGRYKMGHVKVHGLDISIENPKWSVRNEGTNEEWRSLTPAHYGYIRRSVGADGEQVDVYLTDDPEASETVFVIDQVNLEGEFDEHKVVLGAKTEADARLVYVSGFSDGRGSDRIGEITGMSIPEFKSWLRKKPLKKAENDEAEELIEPVPFDRVSVTRAVKALTNRLTSTFKRMRKQLVDQVVSAYSEMTKLDDADLPAEVQAILKKIELEGWAFVAEEFGPYLEKIFRETGAETLTSLGIENVDKAVESMESLAVRYARTRSAEMVGMKWVDGKLVPNPKAIWSIEESTRKMIRDLVVDALESGPNPRDLGPLIERLADERNIFSPSRADMIARTELMTVHNEASWQGYQEAVKLGLIYEKRWLTSQDVPDDECSDNAVQGWIPLSSVFVSGHLYPLAHPRCKCTLQTRTVR